LNNTALVLLLALSAPALAQSTHMDMPEGSKEIKIALAAVHGPSSEGSALRETFVAPLFSVQWANGYFINMNQVGVHLSRQPNLEYGVIAVPGFARATSLPGSGAQSKRKFTPELGGFMNYRVAHGLSVNSNLLYGGSSDHRGLRLRLGGQAWLPLAEHHSVGVQAAALLANRSSLQADFAVLPEQAGPALREHAVSGGLRSTSLGGQWSWQVSHKYTLNSSLEWRRLHGSAAASPRVAQADGMALTTILIYGF
jgi:outer membrane protein